MDMTIVLAKILGGYYLIMGLCLAYKPSCYQSCIKDFFGNAALSLCMGAFTLLFGLAIVVLHPVWVFSWPVIITLTGVMAIIKSIGLILCPKGMLKVSEKMLKVNLTAYGLMVSMVGVLLLLGGFGFL